MFSQLNYYYCYEIVLLLKRRRKKFWKFRVHCVRNGWLLKFKKDRVLKSEEEEEGYGYYVDLGLENEHLTALHPDFLQLCLLAKCYKTGLSILEDDIFEVDQPRDFFLYCYYGIQILTLKCLNFLTQQQPVKLLAEVLYHVLLRIQWKQRKILQDAP